MDTTQQRSSSLIFGKSDAASEDMTLAEHMEMLALKPGDFDFFVKVPKEVVQRALDGLPISQPHAQGICSHLSKLHGIDAKVAKGFQPEHLGIQVWQPHPKHLEK